MVDYIFAILTANDCGACNRFKETSLKKILELSSKIRNITVHNINLKNRGDTFGDRYHPQFRKPIGGRWYPSFYLFTEHDFYSFNKPLSGWTLGGVFENGSMKQDPSMKYSHDAIFIFNWIMENIETGDSSNQLTIPDVDTKYVHDLEQFNVF